MFQNDCRSWLRNIFHLQRHIFHQDFTFTTNQISGNTSGWLWLLHRWGKSRRASDDSPWRDICKLGYVGWTKLCKIYNWPHHQTFRKFHLQTSKLHELRKPNTFHSFWFLPQIILYSIGDMLFSFTIYAWCYTEASKSFKTFALVCVVTELTMPYTSFLVEKSDKRNELVRDGELFIGFIIHQVFSIVDHYRCIELAHFYGSHFNFLLRDKKIRTTREI